MSSDKKVDIVGPEGNKNVRTFIFKDEDHTLGNSLRYILMRDPAVDFCGYTVPHPMEPFMNLRLQTKKSANTSAKETIKGGLDTLIKVCDHVREVFDKEISKGAQGRK
eukprot:g554.t1